MWRQGRLQNGDVVVFNSIETFVSFSFVWYVCVVAGRKMTMWQGIYQVRCAWRKSCKVVAEGCATKKISSVVLVFYREVVEVYRFLNLYLEWKYKRIRYAMYSRRHNFYLKVGFVG
jgi:hypothetical protein